LRTAAFCVLALALTLSPSARAEEPAKAVYTLATSAIDAEAAAQAEYQQWTEQRESLAAEVRDMKAARAWLEFQNRKYEKYIDRQESVIVELERRKVEAERIRHELEPFLDTVVDRLGEFVDRDLPFLAEERSRRIRFLRDSLDDYHLALSEKLRRVFEALMVETEYGRSVSTTAEELVIHGRPTRVSTFRLGRTALFYQTADGTEAGMWNRAIGKWEPLEEDLVRNLKLAGDMADRKRAVELLQLPVEATR
jgi:cell division protein FtsB